MRIGPLGIWELLIILVVVLLIFGPRRLPEMAKGLGQSVREFRKGIKDMRNDFEEGADDDTERKKGTPAAQPQPAASTAGTGGSATDAASSEPAPATAPSADAAAESTDTDEDTQRRDAQG